MQNPSLGTSALEAPLHGSFSHSLLFLSLEDSRITNLRLPQHSDSSQIQCAKAISQSGKNWVPSALPQSKKRVKQIPPINIYRLIVNKSGENKACTHRSSLNGVMYDYLQIDLYVIQGLHIRQIDDG